MTTLLIPCSFLKKRYLILWNTLAIIEEFLFGQFDTSILTFLIVFVI